MLKRIVLPSGLIIESNHEKAVAVLIKGDRIKGPVESTSLNHHTGINSTVTDAYRSLLRDLAKLSGVDSIRELSESVEYILICIPGAATENDSDIVKSILVRTGWNNLQNICVVDDTWAAAVSAGENSIVCIADTGSSVFVDTGTYSANRNAKFDGWGPLIGDYGSGVQLAIDTLRQCCRELDRGKSLPILDAIFKEHSEMKNDFQDLQEWFDSIMNGHASIWIAKLSGIGRTIMREVGTNPGNHREVHDLIANAAKEFANTIEIAHSRHLPKSREMSVSVYGYMTTYDCYFDPLVDELRKRILKTPTRPIQSIFKGAVMMAISNERPKPNPERSRAFEQILGEPENRRDELAKLFGSDR